MHAILKLRFRNFTVLGNSLGCLIGIPDIIVCFWYSVLSKEYILVSFFLVGHGQSFEFCWDSIHLTSLKLPLGSEGLRFWTLLKILMANFILVSYISHRDKFKLLIIQMDTQNNYERLRTFFIVAIGITLTKSNCQRSDIINSFYLLSKLRLDLISRSIDIRGERRKNTRQMKFDLDRNDLFKSAELTFQEVLSRKNEEIYTELRDGQSY